MLLRIQNEKKHFVCRIFTHYLDVKPRLGIHTLLFAMTFVSFHVYSNSTLLDQLNKKDVMNFQVQHVNY